MLTEKETKEWEEFVAKEQRRYVDDSARLTKSLASTWPRLTVGDLKRSLENVSDDAPVLYQRIEDKFYDTPNNGWETIYLPWEREGEFSEYILAFSAHKNEAADGREVFVINAHY